MKRRCDRLCIEWGLGRWIYLVAGTFLLLGLVVEIICLGMIIVPYLRENEFTSCTCSFESSHYGSRTSCQDVFYRSPSNFPCLIVTVAFNYTDTGQAGKATLYLMYSYYAEATVAARCSSRICYKDKDLNSQQVANLNTTFYNAKRPFTCYVRQEALVNQANPEYSALYSREFTESQVFHCIMWPLLAFGLGSLLIWSVFCASGCDVWGSEMTL